MGASPIPGASTGGFGMTTTVEASRLVPIIDAMGKTELLALNRLVIDRVRKIDAVEAVRAGANIRIGDVMRFTSKHGRVVRIRVTKVNVKTVHGDEVDGENRSTFMKWRVSPQMLQAC
jgi:hypothetical protein